ncbi:MAG TPA: beta-N-acetylhexosaminidase, partial [Candidatus Limnocylindrales bacterium]|nr:beta-N-acetylhexosaminidase [Candidatus Limnocylindrales bacterium]
GSQGMSSPHQLALRCILPGFAGTSMPEWVRRRVDEGLGGVVLFGRNIEHRDQVRALVASLHAERAGLLVAIDEEGGDVTRLEARTGSSYPGNLALGAADDPTLTAEVARAMGAELADIGIDLDLAPVADVNSNPLNPVVGVRSFGANPELVARHTAAWVDGLQGTGVAACAKHFPGHGDTEADSHVELPFAAADPRRGALQPFEAAIEAGVRAVMSAHIVVPALDTAPATISPRVMTGLLRDELGFDGLAVSDGLDMRALSGERGIAEAAVLALIAGCDALCVGGGPSGQEVVDEIAAALIEAVRRGRLSEARLEQAAGRVDALASWRAAQPRGAVEAEGVGLRAARRAITRQGSVRVSDHAVVMRLGSLPSIAAGDVPWGVAEALAARGVDVVESEADRKDHSLVVVVRDLHRLPAQREAVEEILARRPDAVVVDMGVPVCKPRGAAGYIATHGSARVCGQAAAELMRG